MCQFPFSHCFPIPLQQQSVGEAGKDIENIQERSSPEEGPLVRLLPEGVREQGRSRETHEDPHEGGGPSEPPSLSALQEEAVPLRAAAEESPSAALEEETSHLQDLLKIVFLCVSFEETRINAQRTDFQVQTMSESIQAGSPLGRAHARTPQEKALSLPVLLQSVFPEQSSHRPPQAPSRRGNPVPVQILRQGV